VGENSGSLLSEADGVTASSGYEWMDKCGTE